MPYSTWRDLTWMNRNWPDKLEVTLLSAYISRKKILFSHFQSLFERSNLDVLLENEGKIHEGGSVEELYFRKFAGWHLATP